MLILLVDDDPEFAATVRDYLTDKNHEVTIAGDGRMMRAELEVRKFDIVLLDLLLPEEDGHALTLYLRQHSDSGIIMISGAGDVTDRVVSLELGADDFLQKPFELRELLARMHSLKRRLPGKSAFGRAQWRKAEFAGWQLDLHKRKLFSPTQAEVPLTSTEFALLRALVSRPYEELRRDELLREIKGRSVESFGRNIDVHILRLRQKIETDPSDPVFLRTVHGVGYTFCADVGVRD